MPFARPSLSTLEADLQANVQSRLPGTEPRLRRSYIGALTRGVAGAVHELYGYLDWISEQRFTASASRDELVLQAAEFGITPIAATRSTGMLAITGTTGIVVPSGTVWRSTARVEYRSTAEVTIVAGAATASIEAVVAGAAGNAGTGQAMSLTSPIAGIVSAAAASTALGGGADIESVVSLRDRLNLRKQSPPRGGAEGDYIAWAKEAHQDVRRKHVWERAKEGGLGTVHVYFMTYGATTDGVPSAATVTAVSNYINGGGGLVRVAPVTADVDVLAPAAAVLDITIHEVMPATQAVQDAIEAELADLIQREAEPNGTILVSRIREAISTAQGESDHSLTAPAADVTVATGEISVIGTVTFTT